MRDRLPGNPDDLWQWCLDRSRDELLELLALIAAGAVNAVQRKEDRRDSPRLSHAAGSLHGAQPGSQRVVHAYR